MGTVPGRLMSRSLRLQGEAEVAFQDWVGEAAPKPDTLVISATLQPISPQCQLGSNIPGGPAPAPELGLKLIQLSQQWNKALQTPTGKTETGTCSALGLPSRATSS